jgi:hypothetical protein
MRKITTVFLRDEEDRRYVTDQVHPDAQWVLDGEGWATRKYDGTCVMLDAGGRWWARREVKPDKKAPSGWVLVEHDEATGKSVGWEPIEQSAFVKFHAEALAADAEGERDFKPGTYELIGPRINGNPEKVRSHQLIAHEVAPVLSEFIISETEDRKTRDFRTIRGTVDVYAKSGYEGIVYRHEDGRLAKIKVKDFRW